MPPVTIQPTEMSDFEDRLKTFAPRIVGVFYEPTSYEWQVTEWNKYPTNETEFLFARHVGDAVYIGLSAGTSSGETVASDITQNFPAPLAPTSGGAHFDDMLRRMKKKLQKRRVPYVY